jgi:O-antigen ligase
MVFWVLYSSGFPTESKSILDIKYNLKVLIIQNYPLYFCLFCYFIFFMNKRKKVEDLVFLIE